MPKKKPKHVPKPTDPLFMYVRIEFFEGEFHWEVCNGFPGRAGAAVEKGSASTRDQAAERASDSLGTHLKRLARFPSS